MRGIFGSTHNSIVGNQYDVTLKSLFHKLPARLPEILAGSSLVEILNPEFPSVKGQFADLLGLLANGRILHLEFISSNDGNIARRKLRYRLDAEDRYPDNPLLQIGLYVGYEPMRMENFIEAEDLKYRFRLVDIRELRADQLLESRSEEDRILAVLCQSNDSIETIRRILDGWRGADENRVREWLSMLMILCKLRRLEGVLGREVKKMPITVNLMEHEYFREHLLSAMDKGSNAGQTRLLAKLLERKFGPLPEWVRAKLDGTGSETLERWGERLLDAATLTEVFGEPE